MRILIDEEQIVELSPETLEKTYISSGKEASVYRYGDEVLKLYHFPCSECRLGLEDAKKLSKIDTSRVLLPKRIIIDPDTGDFLGYTTTFIAKAPILSLFRMNMGCFMNEIAVLESDAIRLSNHGVSLDDFNLENTIYGHGEIYMIDPGSFQFVDNGINAHEYNMLELQDYIVNSLLGRVAYSRGNRETLQNFLIGYNDVLGIIKDTAKKDETVKQYVKRIATR